MFGVLEESFLCTVSAAIFLIKGEVCKCADHFGSQGATVLLEAKAVFAPVTGQRCIHTFKKQMCADIFGGQRYVCGCKG